MKKFFAILMAFGLIASSCGKFVDSESYHRTAEELYEFGNNLRNGTIASIIEVMNGLSDETLFRPNFNKSIKSDFYFDYCDCIIQKADADSTWIISSSSSRRDAFDWETTVRMLPECMIISSGDKTYKYHCWEVRTEGTYTEKDGYSARFCSSSPRIRMEWQLNTDYNYYETAPSVRMEMNYYGEFYFETLRDGRQLDYGTIFFNGKNVRFESTQGNL